MQCFPRVIVAIVLIQLLQLTQVSAARLGAAESFPSPAARDQARSKHLARFESEIRPLFESYCYSCHGPDKQKGNLALSSFRNGDAVVARRSLFITVADRIDNQDMPPAKETHQPSVAERGRMVQWIRTLKDTDAPDPGRVTLRRLNRSDYNNTIRDLVGVDFKPASDFPEDDVGEGFDNIGEVLSLPPLLMEKYLIAADQILDKATVTGQPSWHIDAEQWTVFEDGKEKNPGKKNDQLASEAPANTTVKNKAATGVTLDSVSELSGVIPFPVDGKYTLKIRAWGEQAGNEPVAFAVKIDDKLEKGAKVPAQKSSPGTYSISIDVKRGMRTVAVLFLNPYVEPPPTPADDGKNKNQAKPANQAAKPPPADAKKDAKKDATKNSKDAKPPARTLTIASLDITGPPTATLSESHKRLFAVKPDAKEKDQVKARRDAARDNIARFAAAAFRRPVEQEQIDRLLHLYDIAVAQGEVYEEAVSLAFKGVLISPYFLFRVEPDRPGDGDGVYALNDHEIATRLSYFIWSSMPDDELLELANHGKLSNPLVIEGQIARMLKDAKARALIDNFCGQWLQLRKLDYIQPDPKIFPDFSKDLRKAMYDEATLFCEMIMREDRSVLEFLDADYTYVNDRLARLYGIAGVTGGNLRKVTLTDHNRGGLVGMGGVLAITSIPTRTSPVKRGKWVLEQLLGEAPPPPPPNVPSLDKQDHAGGTEHLSQREKLERHRADPTCASCHKVMDQIGFGLENFDALGRWRDKDSGKDNSGSALDTSGVLPTGETFKTPQELKAVFMLRKERFVKTLSQRLLTYALGRGLESYDDATVAAISQDLTQNGYRFSVLVTRIATSYPFRYRRAAR